MYPQSMFLAKYENNQNISTENCHFYSCEILQYIAWACFRNAYQPKFHFDDDSNGS